MTLMITKISRRLAPLAAVALLVAAMGGSWTRAAVAAPTPPPVSSPPASPTKSPPGRAAPAKQVGATSAVTSPPADDVDEPPVKKSSAKQLTGKLNLNTASEEQLMLLPTVGPAKAERIVAWRKKNGSFKRIADLRRVKGFGYKTFKKLEAYLDIKGDTTLTPK
jgi:competence ComEA-like helix-hairpin-helix protein